MDAIVLSVIILFVDFGLQLLEGLDVQHAVFESGGNIVVLTQELHDLSLAASLESGLVLPQETVVIFIVLCSAEVLCFGLSALTFDCLLAEEVVAVEDSVGDDGDAAQPDGSNPPQPPGVGLGDEVRVVKHSNDYINSTHSLYNQYSRSCLLSIASIPHCNRSNNHCL